MDPSLSAWRAFLERLPAEHPLRRLVIEATEHTVEDAVLRLAAIVESSDDAILSKTLDGRILSWNAAAARIYGYAAEDVLGRNVSLLIPAGQPDDTQSILARIRQGQGVDHYETTRARKDGRVIEVSLTVSPVRDAAGLVVAASTIARDITERKRAERRVEFLSHASHVLGASLDLQRTMVSMAELSVPGFADWCTVDVVDESGELRRVAVAQSNPSLELEAKELATKYPPAARTDGLTSHGVDGRKLQLLPELRDEFWVGIARDERHLELLRRFRLRSGMVVPLVARGRLLGVLTFAATADRPPYDENDLAFGDELGRRAALAMDNARLYSEAQAANRMKDDFLATLSHELRTPLTPILGWTRILRGGRVDEATIDRALEVIERNAEAQSRLIGDLLDLSRITSGKLRLELRPTELGQVVRAAVDVILPTASARGVTVETHLETREALVYGDADRLQQVAWNLLTNAVKFTPPGGRVVVTLRRVGASAQLDVADTGEGIAPEFQPYIFNRFNQADPSTTRVHGGLGLGLAIVRHLVELHGGQVEARSPGRNQGATFSVRLPLLRPGSAVSRFRRTTDGTLQADAAPDRRGVSSHLEELKVLVVDDEPDAREMLQTLLTMRGARVQAVSSVAEGIDYVRTWQPDLIVADIAMPGADGYEFIARLRALPPENGGSTPALALTAYAGLKDRDRALSAGFQAHLAKPVDPRTLFEALEQLLAERPA